VKALRIELDRVEAAALREALLGETEASPAAWVLVRGDRVAQVVHAVHGPARAADPRPALAALGGVRDAAGGSVLAIAAERLGTTPEAELAASLGELAAVVAVRAAAARLRVPLAWLVEDGVYALHVRADASGPDAVVCARVRDGRLERLVGGRALGAAEPPAELPALADLVLRRVGRPIVVAAGTRAALRAVARSPRPAATLERARIRRRVEVAALSRRVTLALVALRLLGR
jgi:hypothetical protein